MRDLVAAVASSNGTRVDAQAEGSKAQARRVAVEFGGAVLEATNLETARHSDDVVVVARALCEQLGIKGAERHDLLAAARLHDIGKTAIPLEVIEKPGPLTESEWEMMRQHTVIGDQILSSVSELRGIARLVRHSHERWDGKGYPDGLAGEQIPLGSRIIFCADAFHAIRSDRAYRKGLTAAGSLAEVKRNAGTQFDPTVVAAFETVVRELKLAPASSPVRRSSRLSALLLMLAIGTSGSAVAASGILGEPSPTPGARAGAGGSALGGSQILGLSFDDAIRIERDLPHTAAGALGPGILGDRPVPGATGTHEPDEGGGAAGGAPHAGGSGDAAGNESSASEGSSANEARHPHGGAPGQTGDHPNGGPPGQSGNRPPGAPPGQSGNHPQGGPPGQSGGDPQGGAPGQSGGGPPGQSGGGPPGQSGAGPPGQNKPK